MRQHHADAIEKLRATYEPDASLLALIIVGSLAAGGESDSSDVDHILLATDEEFARRVSVEEVHYWTPDFCDYPGGYVEGKIVNLSFIEDAALRGSEPARAQFSGARVVFSKIPGLAETVATIAVYPEPERERKIRSFYAQLQVLRGYLAYGEQKGDLFIVLRAAAGVALFAGRLILAHNRILYPYHKWFLREVARAPEQPAGFPVLLETFLHEPTTVHGDAVCESIITFMDLRRYDPGFTSRFVLDTEWAWLHGPGPVEDW